MQHKWQRVTFQCTKCGRVHYYAPALECEDGIIRTFCLGCWKYWRVNMVE